MSKPQPIQTDIARVCHSVGTWAQENFGTEQPAYFLLRGINEELGELDTSVLKRAQGIDDSEKYTDRVGPDAEKDAVGDMFIYLMDFCYRADVEIPAVRDYLDHDTRMTPQEIESAADNAGRLPAMETMFIIHEAIGDLSAAHLRKQSVPLEHHVAKLIDSLSLFCAIRNYDLDTVIETTVEEVLDREWDSEIQST